MSAETQIQQFLNGTEQANQSEMWDFMVGDSDPIEGRLAPSGQTWGVIPTFENQAEVVSGSLRLKAGELASYPYLINPTGVTRIGAQLSFEVAGGSTHFAESVLLIAVGTDLPTQAFLHFVFSSSGYMRLDWFATGLNGGTTATTGIIPITVRATEIYQLQGLVSSNGTVTFTTSVGTAQLTGLTLPPMTFAIWELTSTGADLINQLRYYKAWANPPLALIEGLTVQPLAPNLSKLASGDPVVLQQLYLSLLNQAIFNTGGLFQLIGALQTVQDHGTATLVNGTVTVNNARVTANSRIFVNRFTDGGTLGDSYSITRIATTSFTITSKTANATQALDTSTVAWWLVNP